jgi:AraC family transcriptional regulator
VFDCPTQIKGGPANRIAAGMLYELRLADSSSALALHGLALELLAVLARKALGQRELRRPAWLKRAEEYLRARFLDSVSINELATEIGVHPMHLAREFRKHIGTSVGAFVRNLRVDYALILLTDPDLPLATISNMTGFFDQAHFTRVFKQKNGMSPGAFRSSRR